MSLQRFLFCGVLLLGAVSVACNRQTVSRQEPAEKPGEAPPSQQLAPPSEPAQTAEKTAERPRLRPRESTSAKTTPPAEAPPPTAPAPEVERQPPAETRVAETPRVAETKPPAPPPLRTATLDAGTKIVVRTTSDLSSATAAEGDSFTATLADSISDGSWIIAPKGSRVQGVIDTSDKGGRVRGKALLAMRLTSLETEDGQTLNIQTDTFGQEAKSTVKKDATKVGVATGIGAAIGAIAGGGKGAAIGAAAGAAGGGGMVAATRGAAAEIPSETVLTFELAAPVHVTEKR